MVKFWGFISTPFDSKKKFSVFIKPNIPVASVPGLTPAISIALFILLCVFGLDVLIPTLYFDCIFCIYLLDFNPGNE